VTLGGARKRFCRHAATQIAKGHKVSSHVNAMVVPGGGQFDDATVSFGCSGNLAAYGSPAAAFPLQSQQWRYGDGGWPSVIYVEGLDAGAAQVRVTSTRMTRRTGPARM